MVTKEQLLEMRGYGELHFTGSHHCQKTIGPRGGIKYTITHVRLSGKCKIWKTRPHEFTQPVKYGMWTSYHIDERNADEFHLPQDCPLEKENIYARPK